MTATRGKPATGQPKVLATSECDEGTRQLVAQRINGKVALRDVPSGDEGKVYLIERHVPSQAELDGLVAHYLAHAGASSAAARSNPTGRSATHDR